MRMSPDDPRPLQEDRVFGASACGAMIGVGVLKAQLIPVAQSPGNIWGIAEGLITMVLRALRPVEKESRAPLPVPFIRHIRI